MLRKEIGKRIRHERNRLLLTQEELGNKCGSGRLTIRRYENGSRTPNADFLARFIQIGADINYIFSSFGVQPAGFLSIGDWGLSMPVAIAGSCDAFINVMPVNDGKHAVIELGIFERAMDGELLDTEAFNVRAFIDLNGLKFIGKRLSQIIGDSNA